MAKGGGQSSVRGALYGGTSIAAVYGTIRSLVWESWGSPDLWYASTRKPRGKKRQLFHAPPVEKRKEKEKKKKKKKKRKEEKKRKKMRAQPAQRRSAA